MQLFDHWLVTQIIQSDFMAFKTICTIQLFYKLISNPFINDIKASYFIIASNSWKQMYHWVILGSYDYSLVVRF